MERRWSFPQVSIKFRFRIASGCKPRTLFVRTNGRLKHKKISTEVIRVA
jgi:hypothetical protein